MKQNLFILQRSIKFTNWLKKERRQKLPIPLVTENITTDPTDNKRKIIEYCEQLYSDKFNNLEIMDWVLKKHKLPQITQYKRNNLNYSIAIKKIEFIIKKLMKEVLSGQIISLGISTELLRNNWHEL